MNKADTIQDIAENLARAQRPTNFAGWQKIGLSYTQVSLLFMLLHYKKLQVKQVADLSGISKSAASQLINLLHDKDLINRSIDPSDRRVAYFSLTDQGKKALKKFHKLKSAGLRSRLEILSGNELQQLADICQKLAAPSKK